MLPRERVLTTLGHNEPDRIPWGEHLIDFNIYEEILGRKSFVNSHFYQQKALWEGRRDEVVEHYKRDLPDLAEALGLDIVTLPFALPGKNDKPKPMKQIDDETYEDENGSTYHVSGSCWLLPYKKNTDSYVPPTIESIEEQIDEVKSAAPDDPQDSKYELQRYIVSKMKGTHFIAALGGGIGWPKFGRTAEESWINLIEQPEIGKKMSELSCERSLRTLRVCAELGLDGIIPCADYGNSQNLDASPDVYRELIYPFQKKQVEEAHRLGLKILLHCCGHIMPIIDEIADLYDAYEAIQTSAGMDIKALKERVGNKTTLWGGIMHEHLNGGTIEDIQADAAYSFSNGAPGGGFILGSSHSLAVGAKIENVREMKRLRDEWGTYPIKINTEL
jgi:uroporphyrinogen decarboxylase